MSMAAHAGDTEGPLVEGLRLGPAPGPDLGGHGPHLAASIVGAAPGRRSSTETRPTPSGRRPRHTLTSREPVTDVL